jgi:hypothetical protein
MAPSLIWSGSYRIIVHKGVGKTEGLKNQLPNGGGKRMTGLLLNDQRKKIVGGMLFV